MAELITKTSAAVAVSDELTTLLDWTSIELFEGLTVIVANAGGGSGNDITDVQIDTSDDGGVTENLDQHDGVPAVPIASGTAKTGTFTETAGFVRVRAVCAEGEDTTATAFLLADSSSARICTLADVKDRLGLTDTEHDTLFNRIITGLETVFDNYTRRKLIANAADVTEYHGGYGNRLCLKRYPIASITSVKEASDYNFDIADSLVANDGYRVVNNGDNGIIYRIYGLWLAKEDSIQIIYRGGFCAAGQAPGDGETALPADIREAAIEQACFIFKRRDDIGLSSVSFNGGSVNKFSAMKLLPMVENILKQYRRPL